MVVGTRNNTIGSKAYRKDPLYAYGKAFTEAANNILTTENYDIFAEPMRAIRANGSKEALKEFFCSNVVDENNSTLSPEEIENKLGISPLVGEVIVTGEKNGLTARIYPDQDVIKAKGLDEDTVKAALRAMLDEYNRPQPTYRQITGLVVRKNPFHRNATRKTATAIVCVGVLAYNRRHVVPWLALVVARSDEWFDIYTCT